VTWSEFRDPKYIGFYISDESFGEKVIEIFDEEKGNEPLFLFGVSIQNHGPYYWEEIYRPYPVELSDGLELTDTQVLELEIYGSNIHDSSVTLAKLIDYFSESDEPVLILAFGDHQAAWSWVLDMPGGPELDERRYSTESFFWANYPLESEMRPLISVSGLAPLMMRKAGLELPLYAKGIDLQFDSIMAYNIAVAIENDESANHIQNKRVASFQMLQFDRMFGKNYLESNGK
jgi:hypothetical protein